MPLVSNRIRDPGFSVANGLEANEIISLESEPTRGNYLSGKILFSAAVRLDFPLVPETLKFRL